MSTASLAEEVDNDLQQGSTSENHVQFATYRQERLGASHWQRLGTRKKCNLSIFFADSRICRTTTPPTGTQSS